MKKWIKEMYLHQIKTSIFFLKFQQKYTGRFLQTRTCTIAKRILLAQETWEREREGGGLITALMISILSYAEFFVGHESVSNQEKELLRKYGYNQNPWNLSYSLSTAEDTCNTTSLLS